MPKHKTKEIWMSPADIHQNTIYMMGVPIRFGFKEWPKRGLGDNFSKYFTYFKGDFSRMNYLRSEFDQQIKFLSSKMLKNPQWTLRLIDKIEGWSKLFIKESKKILRSHLKRMTKEQLLSLYNSCIKYHILSHGVGYSVSWVADAEKELVTRKIWRSLADHLAKTDSKVELADIFSILTTPQQQSYVAEEEKDFLKIATVISNKPAVKKLFLTKKPDNLLEAVKKKDEKIYQIIVNHHKKYCWLAFQYKGPATTIDEYLGRLTAIYRQPADPKKLLNKVLGERKRILTQQKHLIKQLKLTKHAKLLITMAQRMVFIKDFRKDALYHGMYCFSFLFREIGRRLGLTFLQVMAMNYWEIPDALLNGKYDVDELNARQKFAIAYADKKKYIVYTGQEARNFIKKIKFEKLQTKGVKELRGTPACPGQVMGTVKVINIPQQMKKMTKGDIMVAHNTNPNLVPAMKKAAALISESGGLTCHTAIVARELRIPCIVGVAGADKILKDGDRIKVDAGQGVIKKLS